MFGYVLALLILVQSPAQIAPKDDIQESLARASDLYYQARFNDSIQLLTRISDELQAKPERVSDKVNDRLQLALANIGLNENDKAKAYLVEMYTLDPNTVLDPQQFSPKVIELATDARAAMMQIRCQAIGNDAHTNLKSGNAAAIRGLIGSPDLKCVDMPAFGIEAADVLYKSGMDAYKASDFSTALQDFQAAVKFSPSHDMASQYVELSQGRLQIAEDRAYIDWQKNFDAHKLTDAALAYRKIAAFNDSKSTLNTRQASDQYRKALAALVETWNQTCPGGDEAAMSEIRSEISELLPDPSFGADIRSHMMPCDKPALKLPKPPEMTASVQAEPVVDAEPEVKTVSLKSTSAECLQIDYRVAMTRLKTRVDPEIPREARSYIQGSPVTVRVKVRIDDAGNIVSADTLGGNPIFNTVVKSAVERWKFSAAMDASGPRCVDTEIPIVIRAN